MSQNQNKPEDMSDVFPEPENDDQMEQMEEIESGDDMMDAGQAGTASPEIQELKDKYLRLLAEFENYKRRTSKERIESSKFASQDMIASLLPVLDDFERESKYGLATEGSTLIHNKLSQILKQKGLVEMESNGQVFDPAVHEAATELTVPDDKKNRIIDTVEKGYYLSDKIIRYAKVVVGK